MSTPELRWHTPDTGPDRPGGIGRDADLDIVRRHRPLAAASRVPPRTSGTSMKTPPVSGEAAAAADGSAASDPLLAGNDRNARGRSSRCSLRGPGRRRGFCHPLSDDMARSGQGAVAGGSNRRARTRERSHGGRGAIGHSGTGSQRCVGSGVAARPVSRCAGGPSCRCSREQGGFLQPMTRVALVGPMSRAVLCAASRPAGRLHRTFAVNPMDSRPRRNSTCKMRSG